MKKVDSQTINTYKEQIQEERGETVNYPEIAIIKEKGKTDENVNLNMEFLGLDLSDIPTQNYEDWTVYVIPVLYVMTSLISMRLTKNMTKMNKEDKKENKENKEPKEENQNDSEEMMDEMTKQMNFMMPIMTVSIALIAPLGLALYWLVSNLLMIFERVVLNRFFKEGEEVNG